MIVLITDFGASDLYVAQVVARLASLAPRRHVTALSLSGEPNFAPRPAAHLLAAMCSHFPAEAVFLAVVDPGVGSARGAVALQADGQWFVGPDNGLLSVISARASRRCYWRIRTPTSGVSPSFHGRDVFAPVVAGIARGWLDPGWLAPTGDLEVQFGGEDLAEVIHIDHFGNALTGLRAAQVPNHMLVETGGRRFRWAPVFSAIPRGEACWYQNSQGLVEIAVNCGHAGESFGLSAGSTLRLQPAEG